MGMSCRRRAIALLLVLLPLHAAGMAALPPAADTHGTCTDHLCRCAATRPPVAPAKAPCHEDEDASGLLFEHAGCHHGQPPAAPDSGRPQDLPVPVAAEHAFAATEALIAADRLPGSRFLAIDLPTP